MNRDKLDNPNAQENEENLENREREKYPEKENNEKKEYFLEALKQAEEEKERYTKIGTRFGLARVVTFLTAAIAFISWLTEGQLYKLVLGALALVAFLALVHYFNQNEEKRVYAEGRMTVLLGYIDRFSSEWQKNEPVSGNQVRHDFPQGHDLDIFGKNSLFQYLCTAFSPWGCDTLAKFLLEAAPAADPSPDTAPGSTVLETARRRQEAVRELYEKKEFSWDWQTLCLLSQKKQKADSASLNPLLEYAESETNLPGWISPLAWSLPIITAMAVVAVIVDRSFLPYFGGLFFLQIGLRIALSGKIGGILEPLAAFRRSLKHYAILLERLSKADFTSAYLRELSAPLLGGGGAQKAVQRLVAVEDMVAVRHQPFLYFFLTGLFMWDFHAAVRLKHWKKAHGNSLRSWLAAVGEIEALISLGLPLYVRSSCVFPELTDSPVPLLEMGDLCHPLLPEYSSVANSVTLKAGTFIVTGSNMSGKTTFLRSIGANILLAYTGAPVCARSFKTGHFDLYTSLRVEDDVHQGISTFYAEVLRIKMMVASSLARTPMLALIDEIFKGTNTADRVYCACMALKKLTKPWIICLVSTHDFELCDLETDPEVNAENYHFKEHYEGESLLFDYKLREGRSQTTNAQHILRLAGLL
jgi:hypothetical protein